MLLATLSALGMKSKRPFLFKVLEIFSSIHQIIRFSKQYASLFKLFNFASLDDFAYYVAAFYPDANQERLEVVLRYNILAFFVSDYIVSFN